MNRFRKSLVAFIAGALMLTAIPVAPVNAAAASVRLGSIKDQKINAYVSQFDTDGSGYLEDNELQRITRLEMAGQGVTTLQGVSGLKYLQYIDMTGNNITAGTVGSFNAPIIDLTGFANLVSIKLPTSISEYNLVVEGCESLRYVITDSSVTFGGESGRMSVEGAGYLSAVCYGQSIKNPNVQVTATTTHKVYKYINPNNNEVFIELHVGAWSVFSYRVNNLPSIPGWTNGNTPTSTTKPATATPRPATATPKPATATPRPATATPKPATATPRPATATPKPATATPRPATATPKPATATPRPATATPKPATATPRPATATPKPPTATTRPATATPSPTTATSYSVTVNVDTWGNSGNVNISSTTLGNASGNVTIVLNVPGTNLSINNWNANVTTVNVSGTTVTVTVPASNLATGIGFAVNSASNIGAVSVTSAKLGSNSITVVATGNNNRVSTPTNTPRPATATPKPATATPRPATATPRPATATPRPATATPRPTNTTRPATATPLPPTSSPRPTVSPNNTQLRGFITRLYQVCHDRNPSSSEVTWWAQRVSDQKDTGASLAYYFVFSDEFLAHNYSNEQFLDHMYSAFFGRSPDPAGYNYWLGKLRNGTKREVVFEGFVNSSEFDDICQGYGILRGDYFAGYNASKTAKVNYFIDRMYVYLQGRPCDTAGMTYWARKLVEGRISGVTFAHEVVFSPEFTARRYNDTDFLKILYRAFYGREIDTAGLNYWRNALTKYSREKVFSWIVDSAEFKQVCSDCGIRFN